MTDTSKDLVGTGGHQERPVVRREVFSQHTKAKAPVPLKTNNNGVEKLPGLQASTGRGGGAGGGPGEGHFMKNFSFIKNFKREKSDLLPLSKRHSSEISYNVNVSKYISPPPPQPPPPVKRQEPSAGGGRVVGGASLLRAGPRREKTESVILRRNSALVTDKQAEEARLRAMNSRPVTATEGDHHLQSSSSVNNPIELNQSKQSVAGEGGSRFYLDQVIVILFILSVFVDARGESCVQVPRDRDRMRQHPVNCVLLTLIFLHSLCM